MKATNNNIIHEVSVPETYNIVMKFNISIKLKREQLTAANYITKMLLNEIELLYPGKGGVLNIHDNISKGRTPQACEVSTYLLFPCCR